MAAFLVASKAFVCELQRTAGFLHFAYIITSSGKEYRSPWPAGNTLKQKGLDPEPIRKSEIKSLN